MKQIALAFVAGIVLCLAVCFSAGVFDQETADLAEEIEQLEIPD